MKTSIKEIKGNWDLGYVLDKHVLSSVHVGDSPSGHPQFDTTRSEVGEALFKLKYRGDWSQIEPLASQLADSIYPKFDNVALLIPMPASNVRARQPVTVLTEALAKLVGVPILKDLVIKKPGGHQLKDLSTKAEKAAALKESFSVHDSIDGLGPWNALVIDDLFDTGASLEAVCAVLRACPKIRKIYVGALTWK